MCGVQGDLMSVSSFEGGALGEKYRGTICCIYWVISLAGLGGDLKGFSLRKLL